MARYAPVAVAAGAMAALGWWGLARDAAMGNDEVATRWAALLSLRQLAHLVRNIDAVHGTYYLLMHAWMALGTSPVVMRIPSVISMTAAAAMTVIIARALTGSGWAGLFAGLIMALTPTISYYAQTARSYALVFACVLGSTLVLLHAMKAEAAGDSGARITRRWLGYAALMALSGYLNEMSLLVLAAHGLTVLLARYGRRAAQHWAAAAAGAALLVAPLIVVSAGESGAIAWIARPGPADLRILFHDYFGATTVVAVLLVGCAVTAVLPRRGWRRWPPAGAGAAAGVTAGTGAGAGDGAGAAAGAEAGAGAAARGAAGTGAGAAASGAAGTEAGAQAESGAAWWSRGGISLPSVAAPLLVLPACALILESLVARPLYVDRYVLYGEAGAALLAGAGAYRIGRWLSAADRRALIWVPGAVVCLCALLLQLAPQQRVRTPQSRLFDFGGPARYVAANARQGDGVLFFNAFYRKARLGYPAEYRKVSDFALAVPPARTGTFQGRDKPFELTRPLMLGYRRIWVLGKWPSAPLAAGPFRDEGMVLRHHFSLIGERHFRGVVVTLWLRH
jgi:mannosyltransferase